MRKPSHQVVAKTPHTQRPKGNPLAVSATVTRTSSPTTVVSCPRKPALPRVSIQPSCDHPPKLARLAKAAIRHPFHASSERQASPTLRAGTVRHRRCLQHVFSHLQPSSRTLSHGPGRSCVLASLCPHSLPGYYQEVIKARCRYIRLCLLVTLQSSIECGELKLEYCPRRWETRGKELAHT